MPGWGPGVGGMGGPLPTLFDNGLGHGSLALAGKFRSSLIPHQPAQAADKPAAHVLLDVMFPVCMSALR